MHAVILYDWKKCLRQLIWDKDLIAILLSCLDPLGENSIPAALTVDFETYLMKLELVQDDIHKMKTCNLFRFEFSNHALFEARINEESVIKILYCNSVLSA
jgi:hypothetical protein